MSIAACQDARSDAEQVRETTQTLVEGFRDQDPSAVCDVVTETSRRLFVEEVGEGTTDCEDALSIAFGRAPVQDFAKDSTLGEPRISGSRATVIVTSPALQPEQRARIRLTKVDGDWRVDMTETAVQPPD